MTPPIQLYVDGVRVADGSPGDAPNTPYAVDGLTVTWGRETTVDQPPGDSATFTLKARQEWGDSTIFASTITLGRRVDIDAGPTCRVFTGTITDVSMTVPDGDPTGLDIVVTADDLLADLGNRPAAATPWPKETVTARFAHVTASARLYTTYTIASDLANYQVRKADADSATAAELLQNIAASIDGVLWAIARPGDDPYLRLESPAQRTPLRRLQYVAPWVVIVDVSGAAGAMPIGPCIPDLEPIEWRQTMSDLVTSVAITYYTPDPLDAAGPDLGTTALVIDTAAEAPSKPWGVHRVDIDSQLTSLADAQTVAGKILARLAVKSWRLNNVVIDNSRPPTLSDANMLKLLGSATRPGMAVTITPLPPWAPAVSDTFTGYVEGGTLTSTGGVWAVNMWVSLAQSYAGQSARYQDIPQTDPNWQYQDVHPSIRYMDLVGVAGP